MNEALNVGQVFMAIGTILAIIILIVKPLLKLNTTLTTLDLTMKALQENVTDNKCEHKEFAETLDRHEIQLTEHEKQILEFKDKLAG